MIEAQRITFNGRLLERGFWLYIWHVKQENIGLLYVGRTGDSSSNNAASPFSRLSRHLDIKKNAAANMLLRHVKGRGLDPTACSFEMIAIGPLFEEQSTFQKHCHIRDIIASLEGALASYLCNKGYEVVGNHPPIVQFENTLFAEIQSEVDKVF